MRLQQALAAFGRMTGANRAYIVLGENPIRVHTWSENDTPYPPGWPEAAFSLPSEVKQVGLQTTTVPDVARLPPSDAKNTLLAVGVRAWACVVLQRLDHDRGILGSTSFGAAVDFISHLPRRV